MTVNDRRVWNDALQAAVLAIACDKTDPMHAIDNDPCIDCKHKECVRDRTIQKVLELRT